MQVVEKSAEGLSRVLAVTIPAAELNAKLDAKLKEVGPQLRLKGFRPGKVPAGYVKKTFGRDLMGEIVNTELNDLSNAIGALNQGYYFTGFQAGGKLGDKYKSGASGTRWNDELDDCDRNLSCEIVCGAPTTNTVEGVGSF